MRFTYPSIEQYIDDQHRNIQVYEGKHKLIANELQKKEFANGCKIMQNILDDKSSVYFRKQKTLLFLGVFC